MKMFLSIMLIAVAWLLGLGMVFSDLIPIPLGRGRVAFGGGFYVVVGFILAKWNLGRRPLTWALAAAWSLGVLGIVGLWISISDPPSGDLNLALLFLIGPALASAVGGWLGRDCHSS